MKVTPNIKIRNWAFITSNTWKIISAVPSKSLILKELNQIPYSTLLYRGTENEHKEWWENLWPVGNTTEPFFNCQH